jgi:hypothetical protein
LYLNIYKSNESIQMKTFKQYISESGVWDQGTGGGFFTPWKPLPNSGGRNVVPAGSIKPPKNPPPTRVQRRELVRHGGSLYQLPTDDYPDTQAPPPGVAREWPDGVPISE